MSNITGTAHVHRKTLARFERDPRLLIGRTTSSNSGTSDRLLGTLSEALLRRLLVLCLLTFRNSSSLLFVHSTHFEDIIDRVSTQYHSIYSILAEFLHGAIICSSRRAMRYSPSCPASLHIEMPNFHTMPIMTHGSHMQSLRLGTVTCEWTIQSSTHRISLLRTQEGWRRRHP